MSCPDRAEQLLLFTAGLLEGLPLDELDEHLETGCESCNRLLDELEAEAPAGHSPDLAHVRDRLLERIAADAALDPPARAPASGSFARIALAAAAIGGLALAGGTGWYARQLASDRTRLVDERTQLAGELTSVVEQRDTLQAEVLELEAELENFREGFARVRREARLLRSDELIVAHMTATELQPDASARIFWHARDYRCYLHALGLEPPPEGRRYVLWVLTGKDELVAAGSFDPDFDGEGSLFAKLPQGIQSIKRAMVTDEPEADGGLPDAPTGAEQLIWLEADGTRSAS